MDFNNQNVQLQNNIGKAEEDRISKLPDSILHYILSFLNIKHVACTCVLSKRWKHIWTSIPTLDFQFWDLFHPPSLPEMDKFMDFVDRTLLLHHPSNIQKFKLNLYDDMNASRVHSWIENLTSRHVEELSLNIEFYHDTPFSIPVSLFTCESLTKLELSDGSNIHFPKSIHFPKLKSLKLSRIQFGSNNNCWNEQPFSNCLVLEKLVLEDCAWFGMREFHILTPVLKLLEIDNGIDDVDGGLEECDLKIHAPSLVSLKWKGWVAKDYDMSSFLKLDNAEVVFFIFDDESESMEERILQPIRIFLQSLSHVRCLSLYLGTIQVLSLANDYVNNLPTFHNLTELKLLHEAIKHKLVFSFLKAAPNLKSLQFDKFDLSPIDDEIENSETEDLFGHLQSVGFLRFGGELRELKWAELILKKAKSLQTMTIKYSTHSSNPKSKEVIMAELLSYPRSSWRCVVKFISNL